MKENLKKLAKYYKPYLGTFILDMILAMMSAAVALVIPLVVRFITSKVAYMSANEALSRIMIIVGGWTVIIKNNIRFVRYYRAFASWTREYNYFTD